VRIYRLRAMSLPKIAVLATGLAAAVLAITISPQVAHAFPSRAANCANCHTGSTSATTTATPSTTTPVAGATYTVAITLAANPTGGNSGYAIIPVTAGTGTTNGGDTGAAGITAGLLRMHAVQAEIAARHESLARRFTAGHPDIPMVEVPAASGDIHDLAGLRMVGSALAGK